MREGAESTYTREGGEAVDQSGGKARHYEHLGPIFCAFSTKYLEDKTNQKSSQNIPVLTNVVLVRGANRHQIRIFFNIVQKGGGKPMFKKYVANFV